MHAVLRHESCDAPYAHEALRFFTVFIFGDMAHTTGASFRATAPKPQPRDSGYTVNSQP